MGDIVTKLKNMKWFQRNGFCYMDLFLIVVALGFCFLTMYYADITVTGRFSLVFLDSLFDGKRTSFYENALATGIVPEGAVYDIGMYVIFGIWNLPIWIAGKFVAIDALSIGCLLWYKLLLVLFTFIVVKVTIKIGRLAGFEESMLYAISLIMLLSLLFVLPVFAATQYDIIPLSFCLVSIYYFLRRNHKLFLLYSAIAMVTKPLVLFVFIALVLVREKRIIQIIGNITCGVFPMMFCKMIYSFNDGFNRSNGDFLMGTMSRLFHNAIDVGNSEAALFFVALFGIYIYCYCCRESNRGGQKSAGILFG